VSDTEATMGEPTINDVTKKITVNVFDFLQPRS